jgi:hypothetical protein
MHDVDLHMPQALHDQSDCAHKKTELDWHVLDRLSARARACRKWTGVNASSHVTESMCRCHARARKRMPAAVTRVVVCTYNLRVPHHDEHTCEFAPWEASGGTPCGQAQGITPKLTVMIQPVEKWHQ